MPRPVLFGIGGAHMDRRGTMHAPYIRGASIPGRMVEETGGGMFNALRTAVQFGVRGILLSARGGDAAGETVAAQAKRYGITDISAVFLDRTTASYTALLDNRGEVVAALADMDIYETALPRAIVRKQTREAITAADGILFDANMPETAITRLAKLCDGKPLFAMAISPAKAVRLQPVLPVLTCLFLNKREARAICGLEPDFVETSENLAARLAELGLKACMLTDGEGDICLMQNGDTTLITPPPAMSIVDVTGAGDALAGAATAMLICSQSFQQAAVGGVTAASLTVETSTSVADFSNLAAFAGRKVNVRIGASTSFKPIPETAS